MVKEDFSRYFSLDKKYIYVLLANELEAIALDDSIKYKTIPVIRYNLVTKSVSLGSFGDKTLFHYIIDEKQETATPQVDFSYIDYVPDRRDKKSEISVFFHHLISPHYGDCVLTLSQKGTIFGSKDLRSTCQNYDLWEVRGNFRLDIIKDLISKGYGHLLIPYLWKCDVHNIAFKRHNSPLKDICRELRKIDLFGNEDDLDEMYFSTAWVSIINKHLEDHSIDKNSYLLSWEYDFSINLYLKKPYLHFIHGQFLLHLYKKYNLECFIEYEEDTSKGIRIEIKPIHDYYYDDDDEKEDVWGTYDNGYEDFKNEIFGSLLQGTYFSNYDYCGSPPKNILDCVTFYNENFADIEEDNEGDKMRPIEGKSNSFYVQNLSCRLICFITYMEEFLHIPSKEKQYYYVIKKGGDNFKIHFSCNYSEDKQAYQEEDYSWSELGKNETDSWDEDYLGWSWNID